MKLNLATILSGFNLSKINNNFTAIENELQDKVLYRDNPVGEPNEMENVIDMNSNKIINLGAPTVASDAARLSDVQDAIAGGTASLIPFTPYLDIVAINVQDAIEEVKDDVEAADAAITTVAGNLTAGLSLKVPYTELASSTGGSIVGLDPGTVGSVVTTVQTKSREVKSLLDFMSSSLKDVVTSYATYTAQNRADMLVAVNAAWTSAIGETPHDLLAPAGRYELGDFSFPWRQSIVVSLLDCKNVTLYCEGPATIFATTSSEGADVFQLNGLKNFHVKGFPTITADLTATLGAGSNACSITGGFDNITLELSPDDCQSIDKTTHIDGGKALSIQCDAATLEVGSLKATILAKRCSQGFGFESGLFNFLNKKTSIDVDLVAEDCYVACTISAAEALGVIPAGTHSGVRVRGQAINCQKDVQLARVHGAVVDMQIVTTKSEADRRLNPQGSFWFAPNTIVEAFICNYAKNSQIAISGNKGTCAYKAQIGAASAGASGLSGATEHSNIFLDIGGTASIVDILPLAVGADVISNSELFITQTTSSSIPTSFYLTTRNNTLSVGPSQRLSVPKFAGRTSFAFGADGITESAAIDLFSSITGLQGKGTITAGAVVTGLYDNSGTFRFGIINGNGIAIDSATSSGAIGAYISKYAVYDPSGVLIGYFPIYA